MKQPSSDIDIDRKPKQVRHLQPANLNSDDGLNVSVRLNDDYDDEQDPENLQSVESKHFDSFYQDIIDNSIDQGRFKQNTKNILTPNVTTNMHVSIIKCTIN